MPVATGNPYVPDRAEFVRPCGIESLLGFGGVLAPTDLYVIVLFSRAPIPRGGAGLFRAVSHSLGLTLQPFAGARPPPPPTR